MKKFIFYSLATLIIAPQTFRLFGFPAGLCDLQNFLALPFLPAFPLLGHLIGKLCISAPKNLYPSQHRNQVLVAKAGALGLILILCTSLLLELPILAYSGPKDNGIQITQGLFLFSRSLWIIAFLAALQGQSWFRAILNSILISLILLWAEFQFAILMDLLLAAIATALFPLIGILCLSSLTLGIWKAITAGYITAFGFLILGKRSSWERILGIFLSAFLAFYVQNKLDARLHVHRLEILAGNGWTKIQTSSKTRYQPWFGLNWEEQPPANLGRPARLEPPEFLKTEPSPVIKSFTEYSNLVFTGMSKNGLPLFQGRQVFTLQSGNFVATQEEVAHPSEVFPLIQSPSDPSWKCYQALIPEELTVCTYWYQGFVTYQGQEYSFELPVSKEPYWHSFEPQALAQNSSGEWIVLPQNPLLGVIKITGKQDSTRHYYSQEFGGVQSLALTYVFRKWWVLKQARQYRNSDRPFEWQSTEF